MANLDAYKSIFVDVFSVSEDELNDRFSNDNIDNWDSIRHLSLITSVEEVFDIMLDTEDILGFTSYALGMHILNEKYNVTF